jgi:AraC family transcriptional regulator, arabinose operon regulatory protein
VNPLPSDIQLPTALLDRHNSIYRSLLVDPESTKRDQMFGIGFLNKTPGQADTHEACPGHYSAIYVLAGSGTYRDSTGAHAPIRPGSVFQRLPDRRHTAIFDPGVRYVEVFLAFAPWLLEPTMRILGLGQRPVVHPGLDLALVRDLAAAHDALEHARERELPRLYLQALGLLTALFTRGGAEPEADSDAWIDEACRQLADEARAREPLSQVARRLGQGYESFRKDFRARTGVSPGEYRIRRRIDSARAHLLTSTLPIKDIAYRLGYPNPAAFSLQFKAQVGLSPEAYRKRGG